MPGVFCDVLTDARTAATMRDEWSGLLEASQQGVYFLRPEWNLLWWEHFAPEGSGLYLITCRESATRQLLGLAPFYRRRRRVLGITELRELLFVGSGVGLETSEGLDIIARRGHERTVAQAVAAYLRGRSDWDCAWLWKVPTDSGVLPSFTDAMDTWASVVGSDRAPYVDTSGTWESFKNTLGRNMRIKVGYYPRRLFRRYNCEFRTTRTEEELDTAMTALVELHQARWRSKGELGAFHVPELEPFLRRAAQDALAEGRLRLWTLLINHEVVAALLGFVDNGVVHFLQMGHSPAFSKENLGYTLFALCLQNCIDDPTIRMFDFMGGTTDYKASWASAARENATIEVLRPGVRSWMFLTQRRIGESWLAFLRAVTPMPLRRARREWIRRRSSQKRSKQAD